MPTDWALCWLKGFFERTKVDSFYIGMLATCCENVILCDPDCGVKPTIAPLRVFAKNLVMNARISMAELVFCCALLIRLKNGISKDARGMFSTIHRILLSALAISQKCLRDTPMNNTVLAYSSGVFNVTELNLMERQLLGLLEYKLYFNCEQIYDVVNDLPLQKVPRVRVRIPNNLMPKRDYSIKRREPKSQLYKSPVKTVVERLQNAKNVLEI